MSTGTLTEERSSVSAPGVAPLFVVGCPRSGTSLTRSLMRCIPSVCLAPDEIQVLPTFVALCEKNAGAGQIAAYLEETAFADHMRRRGLWPGRAQIETRLGQGAAKDFREVILAVAEKEGLSGLGFWGDKTPENVFQLELIARLWPDARVLHVMRDPRATVLSMRRSWGRSVLRGSVIWRDAIRAAERAEGLFPAGAVRTLRYEALVAEPARELAGLADWLGVVFEPDALAGFQNDERWGHAAGRSGVVAPPLDNWRKGLTTAQVRQIEEIVLDEMKRVGYVPTLAETVQKPGQLRLRLVKLADAARVLRASARERGLRATVDCHLNQRFISGGV